MFKLNSIVYMKYRLNIDRDYKPFYTYAWSKSVNEQNKTNPLFCIQYRTECWYKKDFTQHNLAVHHHYSGYFLYLDLL